MYFQTSWPSSNCTSLCMLWTNGCTIWFMRSRLKQVRFGPWNVWVSVETSQVSQNIVSCPPLPHTWHITSSAHLILLSNDHIKVLRTNCSMWVGVVSPKQIAWWMLIPWGNWSAGKHDPNVKLGAIDSLGGTRVSVLVWIGDPGLRCCRRDNSTVSTRVNG